MKISVAIGYNEDSSGQNWVELEFTESGIVYTSDDCKSVDVIQRLLSFVPNRFANHELVYIQYSVEMKQVSFNRTKTNVKTRPTIIRWEKRQ